MFLEHGDAEGSEPAVKLCDTVLLHGGATSVRLLSP